jgi:hypothetical protein
VPHADPCLYPNRAFTRTVARPGPCPTATPNRSSHRGAPKACVALGNTQMRVYHVLLSTPGMRYHDLGHDYYDQQRHVARQVSHHVGKLASLGYEVTLTRPTEPGEDPREP